MFAEALSKALALPPLDGYLIPKMNPLPIQQDTLDDVLLAMADGQERAKEQERTRNLQVRGLLKKMKTGSYSCPGGCGRPISKNKPLCAGCAAKKAEEVAA